MTDTLKRYGLDSFDCMVPMSDGPFYLCVDVDPVLEKLKEAAWLPSKATVDDYGSGSDYHNMDATDAAHMTGWNDCVDATLAARST